MSDKQQNILEPIKEKKVKARTVIINNMVNTHRDETIRLDLEIKYLEGVLENTSDVASKQDIVDFYIYCLEDSDFENIEDNSDAEEVIKNAIENKKTRYRVSLSKLVFAKKMRDYRGLMYDAKHCDNFPEKIDVFFDQEED